MGPLPRARVHTRTNVYVYDVDTTKCPRQIRRDAADGEYVAIAIRGGEYVAIAVRGCDPPRRRARWREDNIDVIMMAIT